MYIKPKTRPNVDVYRQIHSSELHREKKMSINRISVVLVVTIIVSNTVHCTVSTLPATNTHTALHDELLNVLKKFHSSSPGTDPETPVTGTTPISPHSGRISIMHFPGATSSFNADQSSKSSANPIGTPNPLVPGVLHQPPFGLDLQVPDRVYNQMTEPSPSRALLQSRGIGGNPLPVSVPPTIADPKTSPTHMPPASSHSPNPTLQKIEPVNLSPKFNQELTKLLGDLRMTPGTLQEPAATPGQNQMIAPGETTLQLHSPGSPISQQPPRVQRPILGPNQTPLDYLLSPAFPIHQLNSINRQPLPTNKPRPNLDFVKYLLTLPRYQQALNELIASQSSIQT
ncbi:uncharacterized protein LOC113554329 [Rhopalosiphum maidis]|uniref:uncharacterized protein LOC113554329 n=1 Tax=Rhopalosiphum maidis TaxID=43146 RepID=UPI000EFE3EE9|nr:uncharacterized protein LOC113554329 [Rhopalosiphum maidis]